MIDFNRSDKTSISNKRIINFIDFIIVFFFIFLYSIISINFHYYFEEFDGIAQVFESKLILSGKGYSGWGSNYWGPLYTLILTLLFLLTGDYFLSGKIISAFSIGFIGFIISKIIELFTEELDYNSKYFTLLYFFSTPFIFLQSLRIENEAFASLLVMGAVYYYLKYMKKNGIIDFLLYSLFMGLAIITRYTNFFLLFFPLLILFNKDLYRKIANLKDWLIIIMLYISSFIPLTIFIIISFIIKGEYLNLNYLNIAAEISKSSSFWTYGITDYNSFIDVIFSNFTLIVIAYFVHIYNGCLFFLSNLIIIIIILPVISGFIYRLGKINRTEFYLFLLSIFYFFFRSLGPLKNDFYLLFLSMITPFSYYFIQILLNNFYQAIKRIRFKNNSLLKKFDLLLEFRKNKLIFLILITSTLIVNSIGSYYSCKGYCFNHLEIEETDIINAGTYLKENANRNETILTIHLGYAYYAETNSVYLPHMRDIDNNHNEFDIFNLTNYPSKYRKAQPYYIFSEADDDGYIDYLIIDELVKKTNKLNNYILENLEKDEWNYEIYNFKVIYKSSKCIIFEVKLR